MSPPRGRGDPKEGWALLGERAWLDGREAARHRLGADFDLRAWHTGVLAQGSLGLADLAARLARP
ncbi:DUF885 family protein [Streptomyces sp. 1114.5]|uniref:DUF885 family protein n=1 Tax=Streptomyces sp. 1114.5 TaxID=1938830 RepID=UPI000EAE3C6D